MNAFRKLASCSLAIAALLASGCGTPAVTPDPQALATLAPTGTLRVGVYPGSPTSMVRDARTGAPAGVAHDLGNAFGARLGVPVTLVEFSRIAQALDALKAGDVDFTFTNATEARARDVDFSPVLLRIELGYLVPKDSPIAAAGDVDRPGVRVGVTRGSTSERVLSRQFKGAAIVPADSIKAAREMLRERAIDAYATNKALLFEISDELPGSRVLDGNWGFENMAIAIPKGRAAGMPTLSRFAKDVAASGQLQAIVQRAGLRGSVPGE
jgi:polar amino acid transport system substrate-binding protein